VGIRGEHLLPVEQPFLAVAHRAEAGGEHVGARTRLTESKRTQRLPGNDARQDLRLGARL